MKKGNLIKKMFMHFFIFILLISLTGCFETISNFDVDPKVRRANPYLKQIDVDNETLHAYAINIIENCDTTDSACVLNSIYRHIVEHYQYISDPEDEEVIQSPYETMSKKGGDCEDLTILLISLLENIGINSYLVLTETHAYALAININPSSLWPYVEESLITQVEKDNDKNIRQLFTDTLSLNRKSSWYYGGDGNNLSESFESLTFTYDLSSNRPIDLYIVPSKEEFNAFVNDTSFTHFSGCQQRTSDLSNENCSMKTYGGIIVHNPGFRPASITIEIEQYFKPSFYQLFKNNSISTYLLNDKQSVVLDPTAGEYGYPGYDANVTGEKIAFNPHTKEYFYLD
ncbi:MAG: transglutaminase domain-containing protein [Candidatus Thermoplasmatota archaeon]|nr:transglutaminase domain-containing protein [Candidatus Thermoplasmatota archaeon]